MTRFETLQQRAWVMTRAETAQELRALARDERFASVIGAVEELKSAYVTAIAAQKLAPHHGCLEHCGGSIHALDALLAQLSEVCAPARKAKEPPAEPLGD
jgi:hypothetical protein